MAGPPGPTAHFCRVLRRGRSLAEKWLKRWEQPPDPCSTARREGPGSSTPRPRGHPISPEPVSSLKHQGPGPTCSDTHQMTVTMAGAQAPNPKTSPLFSKEGCRDTCSVAWGTCQLPLTSGQPRTLEGLRLRFRAVEWSDYLLHRGVRNEAFMYQAPRTNPAHRKPSECGCAIIPPASYSFTPAHRSGSCGFTGPSHSVTRKPRPAAKSSLVKAPLGTSWGCCCGSPLAPLWPQEWS